MGEKECPNCGKKYKLGLKDRLLRKQTGLLSRGFPALKAVTELAEDYCNECWKEKVQPMATAILGGEKNK